MKKKLTEGKRRQVQFPIRAKGQIDKLVKNLDAGSDYDFGVGRNGHTILDIDVKYLDQLVSILNNSHIKWNIVEGRVGSKGGVPERFTVKTKFRVDGQVFNTGDYTKKTERMGKTMVLNMDNNEMLSIDYQDYIAAVKNRIIKEGKLTEASELLKQAALSPAEWAKAKKLKGFDPKNYLWDKKQGLHLIRKMYSYTEEVNEANVNPKLVKKVNQFVKGISKAYDIPEKSVKLTIKQILGEGYKAKPINLFEAPMDKRFQKEWEKNCKVLLTHIKHEESKKNRENYRLLNILTNQVMDAMNVPAKLATVVGVQEGKLTEALARGLKPLLVLGSKITKKVGEDALVKLSDKFDRIDDEYAGTIASHLNMAIELMQDGYPKDATGWLKQFNKACKDVLKGKSIKSAMEGVSESVNEAKNVKIGDVLYLGKRKGKVIKVMSDMVNVDFGNGDVYGITFARIKGDKITEGKVDEASRTKVFKAAKKGSYPVTLVAIDNGKVVHQELARTPEIVPAAFNVLQIIIKNKYPNAKIRVEDNTGKLLFVEGKLTEIKKGDYVDDYGDIGLVNKVKGQVAYVKFNLMNHFQPMPINDLKKKSQKHKGKDLYIAEGKLTESKKYDTKDLKSIEWKEGVDVWVPDYEGKSSNRTNIHTSTMWLDANKEYPSSVSKRGVWEWIEKFEKKFGKTKWIAEKSTVFSTGYDLIPVKNKKFDKHMETAIANKMKGGNKDTLGLTSPYGNKLDKWS